LRRYVYAASDPAASDNDGLLQRFQLLVWPDFNKPFRVVDEWPDTEAKATAYAVFQRLAALNPSDYGAVADDEMDPYAIPTLRFTDDAQQVFYAWWERLETHLRSGELTDALVAHLGKYRSLMPALALLFHLIDRDPAEHGYVQAVGLEATVRAVTWCDEYIEQHAVRVYSSAANPGLERASTLLKHIQRGEVPHRCTVRDIYVHGWERLQTSDEAEDALRILEDYGWVRVVSEEAGPKGGRPPKLVYVHPSLRTVKSTGSDDDDDE
jgi:putative DNA primase/helicase